MWWYPNNTNVCENIKVGEKCMLRIILCVKMIYWFKEHVAIRKNIRLASPQTYSSYPFIFFLSKYIPNWPWNQFGIRHTDEKYTLAYKGDNCGSDRCQRKDICMMHYLQRKCPRRKLPSKTSVYKVTTNLSCKSNTSIHSPSRTIRQFISVHLRFSQFNEVQKHDQEDVIKVIAQSLHHGNICYVWFHT